jgi:glutamate racemase
MIMAQTAHSAPPKILVFDSGVGGLTVYHAIRAALPEATFVYVADDAAFPYGRLSEEQLVVRVVSVFDWLMPLHRPDAIVIACNTASTIVLPHLRARFAVPVVGTVPAIKTGAAQSQTGVFAVLATPGTISRDYTRRLIAEFATGKHVELVGSKGLAHLAEMALRGQTVDPVALAAEIAPCFVDVDGRKTDMIVLGCTHYPLLLDAMQQVSLWPVRWIDPAPAIAKRVLAVLPPFEAHQADAKGPWPALFTSGRSIDHALQSALLHMSLAADWHQPFAFAA